ncbi:MAG: TrmH family RNA methyltransferase [Treponema sp.]|jgi:TrmH family RNA methyltransferase|nr:TrmH family RNA methyltransferase [Treponema sp.]
MIDPSKLFQLKGGQKRRKLALCFGALERDIAGIAEKGTGYNFRALPREEYTKKLVKIVLEDPKLPPDAAEELNGLLSDEPFDERRICNCARNHLLRIIGTFPAEWDLVIAPHLQEEAGMTLHRNFFPGIRVYAEDIRSPFNLGSIFRTAEAMGVEKLYLSPFCTNPEHPRAIRSGMGCIETLGWERKKLDDLPADLPVFALETGGTPLDEFRFPEKGICILGSEELGISPQALARADYGRVSIPLRGLKASLNVGVAFGILMQKWIDALTGSAA